MLQPVPCPFSRAEQRRVAARRRPERRSGVMLVTRGLGVLRGVALPAVRWLEAEAMSLSSPAQRSRPSISILACKHATKQESGMTQEISHPVEIEFG